MCGASLYFMSFAWAQPVSMGGPALRVLAPNGAAPDAFTAQPNLSFDGRYLAFSSKARNLLPGIPAGVPDAALSRQWYLLDRVTRQLDRVSVNDLGEPQAGGIVDFATETRQLDISDDGRYVVFDSPATNLSTPSPTARLSIYLHDRVTKTTRLISDGLRFSRYPRFVDGLANEVAFACIPLEGTGMNGASEEVCISNSQTGAIRRVVLPRPYLALGRVSKNGRYIPCHAPGTALGTARAQIARCDLQTGQVLPIFEISDFAVSFSYLVRFSSDGSVAAFANSGNLDDSTPGVAPYLNVYSWHAASGQIRLLSQSRAGGAAFALGGTRVAISEDGRRVAFVSQDANLVLPQFFDFQARFAIYVRDLDKDYNVYGALLALPPNDLPVHPGIANCEFRTTDFFQTFSTATSNPNCPELSGDGKTLAFSSHDWRYVAGDLPAPILCGANAFFCNRMIDVFSKSLDDGVQATPVNSLSRLQQVLLALFALALGMWAMRRFEN